MRKHYNSLEYWKPLITRNQTLKERMFEDEDITEKTMYVHYIIFNKFSGLESVWAPMPDLQRLLGFVQYCFLPEAYYKWIEGKSSPVRNMPIISVDSVLENALNENKLSREEEAHMRGDIIAIKNLWKMRESETVIELNKFCRKFNSYWLGDSTEFLYLKVFKNAMELGDFVLKTNMDTDYENVFEKHCNMNSEEWLKLCYDSSKSFEAGQRLKGILFKELKEIN